jgi:hypothetical protein
MGRASSVSPKTIPLAALALSVSFVAAVALQLLRMPLNSSTGTRPRCASQ